MNSKNLSLLCVRSTALVAPAVVAAVVAEASCVLMHLPTVPVLKMSL